MKAQREGGMYGSQHSVTGPNEDPYYHSAKPPEPSQCPVCHAVFVEGRWTWNDAPDSVHEEMCPACRRTQDRFPAGFITIKGNFLKAHRDEIVALVKAREKAEKAERPLQRVMGIEEKRDGSLEVTTTDSHIARGIAEALHDAFKGDLKVRYSRDENLVRAVWTRNS